MSVEERERRLTGHLHRAGELLRGEDVASAEREVSMALAISADDVRAQNLLGLVHFRSGRFDSALSLYRQLVARDDDDPALRLNLGLVELRMGRHGDAALDLARVVAREPDNHKAHGYLALAYLRSGDAERAAAAFRASGQDDKAVQLEQRMAVDAGAAARIGAALHPVTPFTFDLVGEERSAAVPADVAKLRFTSPLSISEFATRRLVGQGAPGEPFALTDGGLLALRIDGRLPTRTTGAICSAGNLNFEPLYRRVRGRLTTDPFGEGLEELTVAVGKGLILVAPRGVHFTVLSLDSDILYLRESSVFAFEESLSWENGRIPGGGGSSPQVVQFRGNGRLVMRTSQPTVCVKVDPETTIFVDQIALIGWIGRVVPRQLHDGDGLLAPYLEVTGEGALILEEPARAP